MPFNDLLNLIYSGMGSSACSLSTYPHPHQGIVGVMLPCVTFNQVAKTNKYG